MKELEVATEEKDMWGGLSKNWQACERAFDTGDAQIQISNEICRRSGVNKDLACIEDVLPEEEIERLLSANRELASTARHLFLEVSQHLTDRSVLFLVVDRMARVVSLHATPEMLFRAADIGLRAGASLSEESCGTNAVSLALRYAQLATVRGPQHYCAVFQNWCWTASPIFNAEGVMVGCASLCADIQTELGEKQALAVLLARILGSSVHGEDSAICADVAPAVGAIDFASLSARQQAILEMLMRGNTYKQIGAELGLSTRTVESHVEKLRRKYKARTTVQLVTLAVA